VHAAAAEHGPGLAAVVLSQYVQHAYAADLLDSSEGWNLKTGPARGPSGYGNPTVTAWSGNAMLQTGDGARQA
jgi:hypothetical protein